MQSFAFINFVFYSAIVIWASLRGWSSLALALNLGLDQRGVQRRLHVLSDLLLHVDDL